MIGRNNAAAVTAPIEDEPFEPPPPLRRAYVLLLVVALLLVGTRLWWGWVAEARLRAAVGTPRSSVPRVGAATPAAPALAEDPLAVVLRAGVAARENPEAHQIMASEGAGLIFETPISAEGVAILKQYIAANAAPLAELRRARSMPAALPAPMPPPEAGTLVRALDEARGLWALGSASTWAARGHAAAGDHAAAIQTLADSVFLARAAAGGSTADLFPISLSLSNDAASTVEELVRNGLRIGDKPGDARRADVDALIRALLDTETSQGRLAAWLQRSREAAAADSDHWRIGQPFSHLPDAAAEPPALALGTRLATWAVRPYAVLHSVNQARRLDAAAAGVGATAAGAGPPRPTSALMNPAALFAVGWVTRSLVHFDGDEVVKSHAQAQLASAWAAQRLAQRAFELDHGRPPSRRAELIPDYLPFDSPHLPPESPRSGFVPLTQPSTDSVPSDPTTEPAEVNANS